MKLPSLFLSSLFLMALLLTSCAGGHSLSAEEKEQREQMASLKGILNPAVWAEVQKQSWYYGGVGTADGIRLLTLFQAQTTDPEKLQLLAAYPEGIADSRLDTVRRVSGATGEGLADVMLSPWLRDGVDAYEQAVFDGLGKGKITAKTVRTALEDGAYRDAFAVNGRIFSSGLLNAGAPPNPGLLLRALKDPRLKEKLGPALFALLDVTYLSGNIEQQAAILDKGLYEFANLPETGEIAVVIAGGEEATARTALRLVVANLPIVESFAGPYDSRGLLVDLRPGVVANCHSISVTDIPRVNLASQGCVTQMVVTHELTHAFVDTRSPTWFTEGIAEMFTFEITGRRSGYRGATGVINTDRRVSSSLDSPDYIKQSSLGADFLIEVYKLIGPQQTSTFVRKLAHRTVTGKEILEAIREATPAEARPRLEQLINARFDV